MRGVLYYGNKDIRYSEDIPDPKINADKEVIIETAWCGICGSDLHEYLDGPIFFQKSLDQADPVSGSKLPLPLGHEFSGTIKEIGPGVTTLKVGDRVVLEATTTCFDKHRWIGQPKQHDSPCHPCQKGKTNACVDGSFTGLGPVGGALSQYVLAHEQHVIKLPDNVPSDIGALVEPLSVAWHAVRTSGIKKGETALVLGSGPIGLAAILALQGHGAGKIIVSEPAAVRSKQALKFGVYETVNPFEYKTTTDLVKKLDELTEGKGIDYAYDCSGFQSTFELGVECLAAGGKYVNIAIWAHKPIDFYPMDVTLQEKFVTGSMGYVRLDFEQVVEALSTGKMSMDKARQMITGKIDVKDTIEGGFQELINHKDTNIKILVTTNLKVDA